MPENSDSFQFDDFRTFLKSKNYLYQSELFWVSATVSFFELPAVALGPGQKKYKFLEKSMFGNISDFFETFKDNS